MSNSQDEIVYRFTPHSEGAHIKGVPKRDLTATDLPNISPQDLRDAITPHPAFGKPLYTAVEKDAKSDQKHVIAAAKDVAKDGDA